jgi:hypothetical protein
LIFFLIFKFHIFFWPNNFQNFKKYFKNVKSISKLFSCIIDTFQITAQCVCHCQTLSTKSNIWVQDRSQQKQFSSVHQFEEYDAKANVTDTNKHSILSLKKDFFSKIELD